MAVKFRSSSADKIYLKSSSIRKFILFEIKFLGLSNEIKNKKFIYFLTSL